MAKRNEGCSSADARQDNDPGLSGGPSEITRVLTSGERGSRRVGQGNSECGLDLVLKVEEGPAAREQWAASRGYKRLKRSPAEPLSPLLAL